MDRKQLSQFRLYARVLALTCLQLDMPQEYLEVRILERELML